jgi:hypothetical protein
MRGTASTIPVHIPARFQGPEPEDVTLLQLVEAICDETEDDDEVIATVRHMLRAGLVRLCGNFCGSADDDFC